MNLYIEFEEQTPYLSNMFYFFRWLSAFIGLVVIGFCLLSIPSATSVTGLIFPHLFMGFSIGTYTLTLCSIFFNEDKTKSTA